MDPLTDVLSVFSVRGSVVAALAAGEPWALTLPATPRAALHAVTAGSLWIRVAGREFHLHPGDIVLLPRGEAHLIGSDLAVPPMEFDHDGARAALSTGKPVTTGEGPVTTRVLCASYQHISRTGSGPFSLLPPVLYVPAAVASPALSTTVRLLGEELAAPAAGGRVVLDRTIDILLIHLLRNHLGQADSDAVTPSWLRGLRDPVTASALREIHASPARPWTVDELARRGGVSPATLSRRFAREVGASPAGYLTNWRMSLAAQRLTDSSESVAAIARSVGYISEFAFSRAFARAHGAPPGRFRTRGRDVI